MSGVTALTICLATTARSPGGVWRHIADLGEGLREAGADVRIDVPTEAAALIADAERRGFRVGAAGRPDDIYHAHLANTYDRVLTGRLVRARRRGSAVVITEHLPRTDASDARLAVRAPRPGATLAKTGLKQLQVAVASLVIAVSSGSAAFLTERYRIPPAKLRTIFNGVEVGPVSAGPISTGRRPVRLVATGSVIHQKGYDLLVDAAALATEDWRVDVFGEGWHRQQLNDRAEAVRSPDGSPRVSFRGWSDDVAGEVARAAALVMPSRWEAMPYSALEAMALGRPVIGTSVDGLTDSVVPGQTGWLAEPNPPAIAAAIDDFCRHLDCATAMGEAGRSRVAAEYRAATMIEQTIDAYAHCVGRMPARSRA